MSEYVDSSICSNAAEVDEDFESPERRKICEVLLLIDLSAIAMMLAVIVGRSDYLKHRYATFMFTMIDISLLLLGGICLVCRLRLKYSASSLRELCRNNDDLRSFGKRSFEEWKRIDDEYWPRKWPLVWRLSECAEGGIDFSLFGLGLFAVWIVCSAARMLV
jgi:hypothetical protein